MPHPVQGGEKDYAAGYYSCGFVRNV